MKMDLKVVAHAKEYLDALAKGIDPLSGEVIPEGEVVRQERLMKCFSYTSKILEEVLKGKNEKNYVKKEPFQPHLLDYSGFVFSKEPISISELVQRINDCRSVDMQKLKRVGVGNWLAEQGYLKRVEIDGKSCVRLGEKSAGIGMIEEPRTGKDGNIYKVIVYSERAQQFILEHLAQIIRSDAYAKKRGRPNQGKPWTADEDYLLQSLLQEDVPIRDIAKELGRTVKGVEMHLDKQQINEQAKSKYKNFDRAGLEQLGKKLTKKE